MGNLLRCTLIFVLHRGVLCFVAFSRHPSSATRESHSSRLYALFPQLPKIIRPPSNVDAVPLAYPVQSSELFDKLERAGDALKDAVESRLSLIKDDVVKPATPNADVTQPNSQSNRVDSSKSNPSPEPVLPPNTVKTESPKQQGRIQSATVAPEVFNPTFVLPEKNEVSDGGSSKPAAAPVEAEMPKEAVKVGTAAPILAPEKTSIEPVKEDGSNVKSRKDEPAAPQKTEPVVEEKKLPVKVKVNDPITSEVIGDAKKPKDDTTKPAEVDATPGEPKDATKVAQQAAEKKQADEKLEQVVAEVKQAVEEVEEKVSEINVSSRKEAKKVNNAVSELDTAVKDLEKAVAADEAGKKNSEKLLIKAEVELEAAIDDIESAVSKVEQLDVQRKEAEAAAKAKAAAPEKESQSLVSETSAQSTKQTSAVEKSQSATAVEFKEVKAKKSDNLLEESALREKNDVAENPNFLTDTPIGNKEGPKLPSSDNTKLSNEENQSSDLTKSSKVEAAKLDHEILSTEKITDTGRAAESKPTSQMTPEPKKEIVASSTKETIDEPKPSPDPSLEAGEKKQDPVPSKANDAGDKPQVSLNTVPKEKTEQKKEIFITEKNEALDNPKSSPNSLPKENAGEQKQQTDIPKASEEVDKPTLSSLAKEKKDGLEPSFLGKGQPTNVEKNRDASKGETVNSQAEENHSNQDSTKSEQTPTVAGKPSSDPSDESEEARVSVKTNEAVAESLTAPSTEKSVTAS